MPISKLTSLPFPPPPTPPFSASGQGLVASVNQLIDTSVASLKAITTNPQTDTVYNVVALVASTTTGGGQFVYAPALSKSLNDGILYFAPEAISDWDGTLANISQLTDWTGAGTGVYVKINSNIEPSEWAILPAIYKVILKGVGTATVSTRDVFEVELTPVVYQVNGYREEFPFFQNAYEFKVSSTGTASAEVV